MVAHATPALVRPDPRHTPRLRGRRVLITGAARGVGAGLADPLTIHGARVAIAGLEPELLAEVAGRTPTVRRRIDRVNAERLFPRLA